MPRAGTRRTIQDIRFPAASRSPIFDEYRPGLKRYLHASGAGSFKMNVSGYGVTIDFYGGDSRDITESFVLR